MLIFSKFEQFSSPKCTKSQISESLKLPKMTFMDRMNSPKFDFTQNWSGAKIIEFQQSQAVTSHFESFWSIVHSVEFRKYLVESINCMYYNQLVNVPKMKYYLSLEYSINHENIFMVNYARNENHNKRLSVILFI